MAERPSSGGGRTLRSAPSAMRLAEAAGAVVAECLITAAAISGVAMLPVVAAHLAVATVLGLRAERVRRRGDDATEAQLLALGTAALGPVGAAGMLAALVSIAVAPRRTAPARLPADSPEDLSERLHEAIVAHRELLLGSAGLAPYRDALKVGSFQDKQAALAVITRRFDPVFAPALRLALRDTDAAVRVQAATAAARIEDLFLAGLSELQERLSRGPDDADACLALAMHLLSHAEAGLCPPERAAADLDQALGHLRRAVALAPLRRDVRVAIARVLILKDQPREAAAHVESLETPLSDEERLVLGEALYRLSRWGDLRRLLVGIEPRPETALPLRRVASLWNAPLETCP